MYIDFGGIRGPAFDELLDLCIIQGRFVNAMEIARLLGRELTLNELERIMGSYISKGLISDASNVARFDKTGQLFEKLIKHCIFFGRLTDVLGVTEVCGRNLTETEIGQLVQYGITEHKLEDALKAIKQGNFINLNSRVLEVALSLGQLEIAREANGLGASPVAAGLLIKKLIRDGHPDLALFVAIKETKHGISADAIGELVEAFVSKNELDDALTAAQLDMRQLTFDQLDRLMKYSIARGSLIYAEKIAELCERELVYDEVDQIIFNSNCLAEGQSYPQMALEAALYGASPGTLEAMIDCYIKQDKFDYALRTARLASLNGMHKLLEKFISKCISSGRFVQAQNAARLGGRELTSQEIDKFVEICIAKGCLEDALAGINAGWQESTIKRIIEHMKTL